MVLLVVAAACTAPAGVWVTAQLPEQVLLVGMGALVSAAVLLVMRGVRVSALRAARVDRAGKMSIVPNGMVASTNPNRPENPHSDDLKTGIVRICPIGIGMPKTPQVLPLPEARVFVMLISMRPWSNGAGTLRGSAVMA